MYELYDRIRGCLTAAGMGDAFGAPTEAFSRDEIYKVYGGRVTQFYNCDKNLMAQGNVAGEITDDTSQMIEMARQIVACKGKLTPQAAGQGLVNWSNNWPRYYPRNVGPTTQKIIEMCREGKDPVEQAKMGGIYHVGTSNGCIMRIAGAGAANPGNLDGAVKTAIAMTACSHGTQIAYSAAAAVACAIAAALMENASLDDVIRACIYGCRKGEEIGLKEARIATGARTEKYIMDAIRIGYAAKNPEEAEIMLIDEMGSDSSATGPALGVALGLVIANKGDAKGTIISCGNAGGDTDTIGCIAGSIAGALQGYKALPDDWKEIFNQANPDLGIDQLAMDLLNLPKER